MPILLDNEQDEVTYRNKVHFVAALDVPTKYGGFIFDTPKIICAYCEAMHWNPNKYDWLCQSCGASLREGWRLIGVHCDKKEPEEVYIKCQIEGTRVEQ